MKLNRDNLLGILGVVIIIASIGLVFYGVKLSGSDQDRQTGVEGEPKDVGLEPASTSTDDKKQASEDEKEEESITHTVATTNKPASQPPASGGSSVVLGPSEPATAPSEEDITKVSLNASTCDPATLSTKGQDRIVLELKTEDGDYKFSIKSTPIEEKVGKGKTKKISFSQQMLPSEMIEFECVKIKKDE